MISSDQRLQILFAILVLNCQLPTGVCMSILHYVRAERLKYQILYLHALPHYYNSSDLANNYNFFPADTLKKVIEFSISFVNHIIKTPSLYTLKRLHEQKFNF